MLFLTYFELDEQMSLEERVAEIANVLGRFPPEGVNGIRWDITPDGWGIILFEADSEAAVSWALNVWTLEGRGIFKYTKTSTARHLPTENGDWQNALKRLASA